MTVAVVGAEEAAVATMIESPLSDDNSLARYFSDGDREGPESGGSADDVKNNSTFGRAGRGSSGPSDAAAVQRGRQPTRDAGLLHKKGTPAAYDSSDVLTAFRSRSLSAGRRSRPRPAFDIVQDVYDRIGVTYTRGEAIPGTGPRVVAPVAVTAANGSAASAESSTGPTTTANKPSNTTKAELSNSSSSSAIPSRIYRAQGSTVSSPLREKFQKRYFPRSSSTSSSAARTGGTASAASARGREALIETLERRRSRSLSRTATTKKAAVSASNAKSTTPPPSTLALPPVIAVGVGGAADPAKSRAAWPPSQQVGNGADLPSSLTHSMSAGSLLLKKKQGPFEHPVAPVAGTNTDAPMTTVEPELWSDATGAEEMDLSEIMPSVKDRMAIFGGNAKTNATPTKPKAKARANPRDYPPKVDIYESQTPPPRRSASVEEMEDEKKDDSVCEFDANVKANISTRFEGGGGGSGGAPAAAGVGSSQSSGGGGSRFSRNTPNTNNVNPLVSPYRAAPLVANYVPTEPYTAATRNLSTTSPVPRQTPQQRIGIKYTPVIEIPVDETGAAMSGNDNSSFVSSLGADETAIVRQPAGAAGLSRKWQLQLQPSQLSPTAALQADRGHHNNRYGVAANMSPASAPVSGGPAPQSSAKPSTLTTDWMEKMVEERLQAHLAALEAHMENQLRNATMQLERQMTTKLSALEDKISALVQAQQQQPVAASATGDSTNPSRASYSAGARRGW
jgi:hypothetical protein